MKKIIFLILNCCFIATSFSQVLIDPTTASKVNINSGLPMELPKTQGNSLLNIDTPIIKKIIPIGEVVFQGIIKEEDGMKVFLNNKIYKIGDVLDNVYKIKEFDKSKVILLNLKTKKIKTVRILD